MSREAQIKSVLVRLHKMSAVDDNPEHEVLITFLKEELYQIRLRAYINNLK